MFGLFNRKESVESRSSQIDIGALYSQFFQFGASAYSWQSSPATLASSLSVPDGAGALLTESRRLSKISPLLSAYVRCMIGGILVGQPERPIFADDVPENVAAAAATLWMRAHDIEVERDLLHRVIVDGELLLMADGQVIPPDGYEPVQSGPDWLRQVSGYRIGKASSVRRPGPDLLYLGDRRPGEARAIPWIGPALPYAMAVTNCRIAAGHGLGALAKVAAVIANASPDRITAGSGARTGVVDRQPDNTAGAEPITAVGVGSVPYLKPGEAIARAMAGPDKVAQDYESLLEADAAAALNLPLSELRSDYSSGSFSNLRMAHQDATREYDRRRLWWHRAYRVPLWHGLLSDAFANGALPRMKLSVMESLKNAGWAGPRREPPQPEKEAHALALLTDKGILTAAQALEKLES